MKATKTIEDAISAFHIAHCKAAVAAVRKNSETSHRAAYRAKLKERIMRKAKK